MKYTLFLSALIALSLFACKSNVEEKPKKKTVKTEQKPEQKQKESKEDLIEMRGDEFIEYYPGKKAIKFKGVKDKKGNRDGKWFLYSEEGVELSMTEYKNGSKEGASFVRYPNGKLHYAGKYENNKPVGIWETYDETGKLTSTKDYDKQ